MTMEAVCILRGEKADWDTAKRLLGEPGFMRSLEEFDKDNIPEPVVKKLRKWVAAGSLQFTLPDVAPVAAALAGHDAAGNPTGPPAPPSLALAGPHCPPPASCRQVHGGPGLHGRRGGQAEPRRHEPVHVDARHGGVP
jgi:hypothetical protein